MFTENICSVCSPMHMVVLPQKLMQKCINFVEQRLKFSHSEGSIIP